MGWLPERVVFDRIKTNHLEAHKGRPITDAEFKLMLEACDTVCKRQDPVTWKYLLRGLWHSGLRLGETLTVSWDDPEQI